MMNNATKNVDTLATSLNVLYLF